MTELSWDEIELVRRDVPMGDYEGLQEVCDMARRTHDAEQRAEAECERLREEVRREQGRTAWWRAHSDSSDAAKLRERINYAVRELRDLVDGDSPYDGDLSRVIDVLEGDPNALVSFKVHERDKERAEA